LAVPEKKKKNKKSEEGGIRGSEDAGYRCGREKVGINGDNRKILKAEGGKDGGE
jgi:hypothetical protein